MNSLAPFPFMNPIADLAREGRASDAMQQWMRALQASIGTEYRNYTPPAAAYRALPSTRPIPDLWREL
jgi:hypothetical protein